MPKQSPEHREQVGDVTVESCSVGSMDNNAYLLVPASGPAVLIDAPTDAARLLELIDGREVAFVVTTHAHRDHIGALAEVIEATGAIALCGKPDAASIERNTSVPQRALWTGDSVPLGGGRLGVLGLVGHTPGSIALVLDGQPAHIFSGDSLFPGGPGKTSNPTDFQSLMDDLEREIFDVFGDDTVVHPGHGLPTTLGEERPQLPEWRARGW